MREVFLGHVFGFIAIEVSVREFRHGRKGAESLIGASQLTNFHGLHADRGCEKKGKGEAIMCTLCEMKREPWD